MTEPSDSAPRASRRRGIVIFIVILVIVGAVGGLLWMRDGTPLLDSDILAAHHEHWIADPLDDYDIVLVVHIDGQDEERHELEVRGGDVVSQQRDGNPVPEPKSAYTIPGLFGILEREIEMAKEFEALGNTTLRARFHEKPVMPVVFKRLTSRQGATSVVIRVDSLSVPDKGTIYSASD
jgi:hypothetical protein